MSNRRAIRFLVFLLLAAVGANLWLDFTDAEHVEMVHRPALLTQSDHATAFEISAPGRPTVRLEKGDRWQIVRPFNAIADQSDVDRLVDALAFSKLIDSLDESNAARLGRKMEDFGLTEPRLTLKVFTPGGEYVVSFGHTLSSGEGVYASIDDLPTVFTAATNVFSAVNLPVDSWRRRSVFSVTPDEILSIDIRRGETPAVRLEKRSERWEMVEPRKAMASVTAVKRIIDTVVSCEARKFVWPVGASNETATASVALLTGYGLDPESCQTVVFRTGDGRDHLISFGSAADADSVYALVQGGSAIATVTAEAMNSVSLDAGALIDGRLFPVEKSAVKRISVADGETTCLLACGENGLWRLDSPVSAAADEAAVSGLIDKILVMRTADLDDSGVKVSLSSETAPVSVSREALLGSGGFEQFRSKNILDIDRATVKRLVVTSLGAEKPASVVYDPDRMAWNVESSGRAGVIDTVRLNEFLNMLSPLKAKAVAKLKVAPGDMARYGLEKPSFTIAVDRLLEDSVRRNILFGNILNESGDTYATIGSSDAVFILDGKIVSTLVEGVLDE